MKAELLERLNKIEKLLSDTKEFLMKEIQLIKNDAGGVIEEEFETKEEINVDI